MRFPPRFLPTIVVAIAAVVSLAVAMPAHATGTIVPGTYLTIQGAIDSGVDSVYVKTGEYAEDLQAHRDLILLAYPHAGPFGLGYDYPVVRSLHVTSNNGGGTINFFRMTGIHVRGAVLFEHNASGTPEVTFESCRMDAGFTATPVTSSFAMVRLRGCVVFGGASIHCYYPSIVGNAFIGGGLSVSGNGNVLVRGNYLAGPGDTGLTICCSDGIPDASDNVITGFQVGISANTHTKVTGNTIKYCSQDGIAANGQTPGTITVSNNVIRSCGGNGIHLFGPYGSGPISGNTVDSVGSVGVLVDGPISRVAFVTGNLVRTTGSHGIWMQGDGSVSSNVVRNAQGDGIRSSASDATLNVVGRCAGAGILFSGSHVWSNTAYLNLGSGLVLSSGSGIAVDHNIAFGNHGYGLDASAASSPVLGCDDWYSNASGATLGIAPGATDLNVDPKFCDLPGDVVSLAATSPLLSAGACGLVGALGLGCAVPVTAVEPSSSAPAQLRATPVPARGIVRLSWGTDATSSTIEVFDVTGALRRRATLPVGAGEWAWDTRDSEGRSVDAGVYFVRRTSGDRIESSRLVIQR